MFSSQINYIFYIIINSSQFYTHHCFYKVFGIQLLLRNLRPYWWPSLVQKLWSCIISWFTRSYKIVFFSYPLMCLLIFITTYIHFFFLCWSFKSFCKFKRLYNRWWCFLWFLVLFLLCIFILIEWLTKCSKNS